MIHHDTRQHEDFLKRRGFNPAFLAKVREKREAEAAASKEETFAERIDREIAIQQAVVEYDEAVAQAARREMKQRCMPEWVVLIVFDAAEKHGVSPYFIATANRSASVVNARNEAIYRVKSTKPMLSLPQIGRWFGRDHTSIMHSLAKHSERTGDPRLTTFDLDGMRAANKRNSERRRYEARKAARIDNGQTVQS